MEQEKFSNLFDNACFGNRACQQRRDERIRAEAEQNRLAEQARLAQIEREKADVAARLQQAELDAKSREAEIKLQEASVKLAETERLLREKEALQKIEFQAKMGDSAVERATNLNKVELDRETAQTNFFEEKSIMQYGLIGGGVLLVFILLLFMFK